MATFPVDVHVYYTDADEKTGYETYRLDTAYDDVAENFAAVAAEASTLVTNLDTITWAAINNYRIDIIFDGPGGVVAEGADLGVYAFVRLQDSVTLDNEYARVPAPNMTSYDASKDGLLDPQFQTDFTLVMNDMESQAGNALDFEYAQKRQRKRFQRNLD